MPEDHSKNTSQQPRNSVAEATIKLDTKDLETHNKVLTQYLLILQEVKAILEQPHVNGLSGLTEHVEKLSNGIIKSILKTEIAQTSQSPIGEDAIASVTQQINTSIDNLEFLQKNITRSQMIDRDHPDYTDMTVERSITAIDSDTKKKMNPDHLYEILKLMPSIRQYIQPQQSGAAQALNHATNQSTVTNKTTPQSQMAMKNPQLLQSHNSEKEEHQIKLDSKEIETNTRVLTQYLIILQMVKDILNKEATHDISSLHQHIEHDDNSIISSIIKDILEKEINLARNSHDAGNEISSIKQQINNYIASVTTLQTNITAQQTIDNDHTNSTTDIIVDSAITDIDNDIDNLTPDITIEHLYEILKHEQLTHDHINPMKSDIEFTPQNTTEQQLEGNKEEPTPLKEIDTRNIEYDEKGLGGVLIQEEHEHPNNKRTDDLEKIRVANTEKDADYNKSVLHDIQTDTTNAKQARVGITDINAKALITAITNILQSTGVTNVTTTDSIQSQGEGAFIERITQQHNIREL